MEFLVVFDILLAGVAIAVLVRWRSGRSKQRLGKIVEWSAVAIMLIAAASWAFNRLFAPDSIAAVASSVIAVCGFGVFCLNRPFEGRVRDRFMVGLRAVLLGFLVVCAGMIARLLIM